MLNTPSVLIYRSFWLFQIHNFYYVSRHIIYLQVHSKSYVPRKAKMTYNLGQRVGAYFLNILPPFQIIRCLSFSRYIAFAMHQDKRYVQIHNKSCVSRKAKTTYILEWREQITCKSRLRNCILYSRIETGTISVGSFKK